MADEDLTQTTTEPAAPAPETPAEPAPPAETKAEPAKPLMADAGDDTKAQPPAEFPEDWREKLAGEDEKALNLLKRLGSPADMTKKLIEQERTIRAGKHKAPLGENASEEDVKAYREANGIPETPEGYFDRLDGIVIGDDYKEGFTEFFKEAHENNVDPKAAAIAAKHFLKIEEEKAATIADQDKEFRTQSEEVLRERMGGDYRGNMNDLKSWLGSREGVLEAFAGARGPDGRLLGDNPEVIDFMVGQMREINPLSTVVGSGANSVQTLKDEIGKYEKMMRENPQEYWNSQENQERYRKLLEAEEKQASRAA